MCARIVFPLAVNVPSVLVNNARFCSEIKKPGAIAFTRKPSPYFVASSMAKYLVKLVTAAFAAPYPTTRVNGRSADSEEILIMLPCFCSTITLAKTMVGITVPNKFKSTTFLNASTSKSKIVLSGPMVAPGMFPPAPFTSTSMRPYFATMSTAFCSNTALSFTSDCKNKASCPFAFIFSTKLSPCSLFLASTTTFAPCSAMYSAIFPQSTPVPPVMTTTLSFISKRFFISQIF